MNSTVKTMTAPVVSRIATSSWTGCPVEVIDGLTAMSGAGYAVRDRAIDGSVLGLAGGTDRQGHIFGTTPSFPGLLAWRPPTS